MNRISVFAIIFTLFIPLGSYAQYASSSKTPKKAGDLIESTSYNDHKRGAPRMLQYLPSGDEFVCVNGKNRYTRALYGGHTAWRLEPATVRYLPRMSRTTAVISVFACICRTVRLHRWKKPIGVRRVIIRVRVRMP